MLWYVVWNSVLTALFVFLCIQQKKNGKPKKSWKCVPTKDLLLLTTRLEEAYEKCVRPHWVECEHCVGIGVEKRKIIGANGTTHYFSECRVGCEPMSYEAILSHPLLQEWWLATQLEN